MRIDRPSPLRARRLLSGHRLRDLELATRIPSTTLSRLERGELRLIGEQLAEIASFYRMSADVLREEMDRFFGHNTNAPERADGAGGEATPNSEPKSHEGQREGRAGNPTPETTPPRGPAKVQGEVRTQDERQIPLQNPDCKRPPSPGPPRTDAAASTS